MSQQSQVNLNTSLSSLALLSLRMGEGNDYLDYLYGFVIEALHHVPTPSFDVAAVHEAIHREFGLRIPIATLTIYLKRLKPKIVEATPDGHQFRLVNLPKSSIAGDRAAASGRINEVLGNLKEYAHSHYGAQWSDEQTAASVTDFVREYSIAFVRHTEFRSPLPDPGPETASEHFIVASFIRHCAANAQPLFDSVKTLVESHILANALLCPELKNKGTGFKDVVFVLDTRLLLKAFDLEATIDAENTCALLESVRRLKGVLTVFPETKEEVRSVLAGIKRGFLQGGARGPVVEELRKRGRGVADVILAESKLEENLKTLNISTLPSPPYDESTFRFQIDEAGLRAELEEELGYTLGRAADHDVHVVRSIFALRKGRHVSRIEDAGYVFLTTNSALSRAAFNQQREEVHGWVFSAVITDYHLSHLTWLKSPIEAGDLARTELLSSCHAAMRPPQKVWRTYLVEVDRLKSEGKFTERDHEVLRLSLKAPEALMDVTRGEVDGITESNLRAILHRLERTYAEEKDREIERLKSEQENIQKELAEAKIAAQQASERLTEAGVREENLRQEKLKQDSLLRQFEKSNRDREEQNQKAEQPKQTKTKNSMWDQTKLIEIARKSVPGFNWAIGAAALFALAAIVLKGGVNLGTSILVVGLIILLMVILVLFHRLSKLDPKKTSLMAVVFSWTVLILLLLSFVCLFSSSVVNWPWPIRDWIGRQIESPGKTSSRAVTSWVKVATDARSSKSVTKGRPIPTTVSEARAQFEKWWVETPLTARKAFSHPDLFSGLSLNIRIYRLQEIEDTTKASSFRWADESVAFFEEAGDQKYLAEALLEKAAVFLDLSDLRHANPEEFARVAKDGEATMKRASELVAPEQKSEALRLWSRFYYNLARPKDGNLTEDWNNNFLLVSYDRMRDAYSADPNQLNNVVQLARATQKTAANPPQDTSKDWTQRLWEAQRLIKGKWQEQSATVTDSRSRISPLNILGVITMDAVLRSWMEAPPTSRQESAGPLIEALDKTAMPAQRDTLVLVLGTELEKDYAFDIYYDLARMHAVRLLVAESGGRIDPDGDFAAVVTNIEAARKAGRDTQRQAAIDSINKYPCFSLLNEERRHALLKALGSA